MEEEVKEENVLETNNEEPVQDVQETVLNAAEEVKEEIQEPINEEPSKPPKKKKPIVLIIIIVILLLALIIGLIFLLKPSEKDKDNTENDNTEINTPSEIKSDYRMLSNALEKFDLFFLKLENKEENMVYSPLSIKYALQMLSEGSQGETKAQLDAVIGEYESKKYENNDNMSFANAMFVRETFKDEVKEEYQNMLKDKYNAEVIVDKFENPNNINSWISDKTFKLIPDLIKDVDQKEFFLVNALAIDMKWNYLIHCATEQNKSVPCYKSGVYDVLYTHEKLQGEDDEYGRVEYPYAGDDSFESIKFNGKDNIKGAKVLASFNKYDVVKTLGEDKVKEEIIKAYEEWLKTDEAKYFNEEVPNEVAERFIKELNENYGKAVNSTDFMLYDDDNIKGFAKDLKTYNDITLQYVAIMPKNESLKDYVDKVTVEDISTVINNLKDMKIENFEEGYATIIEGDIPMFKYDYEINLIEDLKKLGITDVFDLKKANLGTMLKKSDGIAIVEARHKANIEFSNEGIKAAAVTTEGGAGNTGGGFNYLFEVPTKRINLTFDNPYLYLIRDKNSGEIWFIGTVYEPITK